MTPITQPEEANHYRSLAEQAGGHFPLPELPRIVLALNKAGYESCLAVATEHLGDEMPDCYALRVTEEDFRDFNHELGPFRFLLMDEQRFWAISTLLGYLNVPSGTTCLRETLRSSSR